MSVARNTARRWVVGGRVQGVGFRWFVARRAQSLGVIGWVRNLPDGRVEVSACGEALVLDRLEDVLRSGPALARVDSVEKEDIPHHAIESKTFDIK